MNERQEKSLDINMGFKKDDLVEINLVPKTSGGSRGRIDFFTKNEKGERVAVIRNPNDQEDSFQAPLANLKKLE